MKAYTLIFLTNPQQQILLIDRATDRIDMPGYLNGLGGKFQPGESILGAARRELHEESGLLALDLQFRGTESWIATRDDGIENDRGTLFLCTATARRGALRAVCAEGAIVWYSRADALAHPRLAPNLNVILPALLDHPTAMYTGLATYGGNGYTLLTHEFTRW